MIPASGAGGPELKPRNEPSLLMSKLFVNSKYMLNFVREALHTRAMDWGGTGWGWVWEWVRGWVCVWEWEWVWEWVWEWEEHAHRYTAEILHYLCMS